MKKSILIFTVVLAGAAEAPKPVPVLTTAEKIALAAIVDQSNKLSEQQKVLAAQFDAIKKEACQREYKQDVCDINAKGEIVVMKTEIKK